MHYHYETETKIKNIWIVKTIKKQYRKSEKKTTQND